MILGDYMLSWALVMFLRRMLIVRLNQMRLSKPLS